VGTATKEEESSTGRVWAAGFDHVTAHSRLARVLKLMNRLFFNFQMFSGRGKPWILNQCVRRHDCILDCVVCKIASMLRFSISPVQSRVDCKQRVSRLFP
jgi:hypothetical protein